MEDKPYISGFAQDTEQQSIQRRANRPRRQLVGVPEDQHTAEMRAALEGASDIVEVAWASSQLALTTVLDNGDDGIIVEASESIQNNLEALLADAKSKLKEYKALVDAAKSLTGSTEDTPAGALATGLLSVWEEQQENVRMMKTEVEQIQREKDQTQITLKILKDQLSVLMNAREFKAFKKQQRKWWQRFCMCGGFKKHNKVGVAPDEDFQTADLDDHLADQLTKQGSTIRSLQKDKAILEAEIAKLKESSEAAKRLLKEMANENKMAEREEKMEREKNQMEEMKMEMEAKMVLAEKEKENVQKLNQVMLETMNLVKQDIVKKDDMIDDLNKTNDRLQQTIMQEAQLNVDRVVIGCLTFYTPQQLSSRNLMSFDQSSSSASQGKPILDMVGKGGYGEVMLGRLNGEEDSVAIKRALSWNDLTPEEEEIVKGRSIIRFEKEARVGLLMSTSPYFPRLLGVMKIYEDPCLITEFIGDKIQGKSYMLMDAIDPRKGCDPVPRISNWNLVAIGEDIIRGMIDLHDRSLLHNDIKDDNVLLEYHKNRWRAVIIDLGMVSTVTYPYIYRSKEFATSRDKANFIYAAPEVLNGSDTSVVSDIFSIGIILKTIGNFIKDDDLRSLGSVCSAKEPTERPDDLTQVLPNVVDLKEKHKAFSRLEGELIESDTEEEEEDDEDGEDVGDDGDDGKEEDGGHQDGVEVNGDAEEEVGNGEADAEGRYQLVEEQEQEEELVEEAEDEERINGDAAREELAQVQQDERELNNGVVDDEPEVEEANEGVGGEEEEEEDGEG